MPCDADGARPSVGANVRPHMLRVVLLTAVMVGTCVVGGARLAWASDEVSLHVAETAPTSAPLALVVSGAAGELSVEITDLTREVSVWRFPPSTIVSDRILNVDLDRPPEGAAPKNGLATIVLRTSSGVVAQTDTVLDRAPQQPTLRAVVAVDHVALLWARDVGLSGRTYRLERASRGAEWRTIFDGTAARYTDWEVEPGRHRYRLAVAIPGADGALKWSRFAAEQVRITPASPSPAPTDASHAHEKRNPDAAVQQSRDVAAARAPAVRTTPTQRQRAQLPQSLEPRLTKGVSHVPGLKSFTRRMVVTVPTPVAADKSAAPPATDLSVTPLLVDAVDAPVLKRLDMVAPASGVLSVERGGGSSGDARVTTLVCAAAVVTAAGAARWGRTPFEPRRGPWRRVGR